MNIKQLSDPPTDRLTIILRLVEAKDTIPPEGLNDILKLPLREFQELMEDIDNSIRRMILSPDTDNFRISAFSGGFYLGYALAKHDANPPAEEAEDVIEG